MEPQFTIYKYCFTLHNDHIMINMPKGAEIIHFTLQNGDPCIWAVVDIDADIEEREFWIVGTGHGLPPGITAKDYIGTIFMYGGAYVWHLFGRR